MAVATSITAMTRYQRLCFWLTLASCVGCASAATPEPISIVKEEALLHVCCPTEGAQYLHVTLKADGSASVLDSISFSDKRDMVGTPVMQNMEPMFFLSVGTRQAPLGRPPEMEVWNVFFDKVHTRPYEKHVSTRQPSPAVWEAKPDRATVRYPGVSIGRFTGELQFTFYAGSGLMRIEAIVSTEEDRRAIIYDAGLVGEEHGLSVFGWNEVDASGVSSRHGRTGQISWSEVWKPKPDVAGAGWEDRALAARHRMIAAHNEHGAVACFPPPHQFFFPRDATPNLKYIWSGRGHYEKSVPFGFGVRQSPDGGGAFVPWFNAPPGTKQRLSFFLLPSPGKWGDAYERALKYTRGDQFKALPGHVTFTSHYHFAHTAEVMKLKAEGREEIPLPDFVPMFKEMGVQAVHLGEFHGDGHQQDPGPLRFPEMQAMFDECKRLSDDQLLVIPGEEVSGFLGIKEEGKHPGHWMLMFPKPVIWSQRRGPDQPFEDQVEPFGKVYRVAGREDMFELLKREGGLGWTAHPRIKASSWTPDVFRNEDFYLSDHWLGAAWKAMPADLSRERLGERCLNLMDDMANWGQRKYLPGEVDVFKINPTHELYGHMNINYLRLEKLPRYQDGWQPIMDVLRKGAFFTTTGEILVKSFTVAGKQSGEAYTLGGKDAPTEVTAEVEGTFPLAFAELISGDGSKVYRERLDLSTTRSFESMRLSWSPKFHGRKWVRLEVWDVAGNGAYSQPVWLE